MSQPTRRLPSRLSGVRRTGVAFAAAAVAASCTAGESVESERRGQMMTAPADTPLVVVETTAGRLLIELYPWAAPASVENFLQYVQDGFYDGLIFHRVIPEFMIQAGGFDVEMTRRPTRAPIPNESDNGLSNTRGTVAMARLPDPHSASSQFYINVFDNPSLDYKRGRPDGWGYTVFGRVREGIDVVDSISMVPTGVRDVMEDVPVAPIVIERATVVTD